MTSAWKHPPRPHPEKRGAPGAAVMWMIVVMAVVGATVAAVGVLV